MSQSHNAQYELERAIQRQLYLDRVVKRTEYNLEKIQQLFNNYNKAGYFDIIPEQMNKLNNDINFIRNSIKVNQENAEDVSKDVLLYIYNLEYQFKQRLDEIEREKIKVQHTSEDIVYKLISSLDNVLLRNTVYKLSSNLLKKIRNNNIDESKIENEIIEIIEQAKIEIVKTENKQEVSNINNLIECEIEKYSSNSMLVTELNKLKELKNKLEIPNTLTIKQELEKITEQIEKKLLNDDIRKEVVKSVYSILKKQGFIITKPQINKETNIVTVNAKRPSGNKAIFKIDSDGKLSYKFDNYKGLACKTDIEDVESKMQEIYGIKIKDKVKTWENPDLLQKDAHRLPNDNNEKTI